MKLLNWATAVVGKEKTGGYSPLRSSNEPAPYVWLFFSSNLLLNCNTWMDLKVGTKPRVTGPWTFPRASARWGPIRGHARASRLPGVPRAGQGGTRGTHRQGLEPLRGLWREHVPSISRAGVHAAAGGCRITRQPPYDRLLPTSSKN